MYNLFLHIILSLTFSIGALAKTWDWKDCISYALEHNLEVKNNMLNSKKQMLDYRNAKYSFFPSLNARSSARMYFGKSIDQNTYDIVYEQNIYNNYGISSSVKIFNSFSNINKLKFSKYNYLVSQKAAASHKNELAFLVLNAFVDLVMYEELNEILKNKLSVSLLEYKKTKKMHELGRKAGSDVIQLEAQIAADSFQLIQNRGFINQAKFLLMEYMNMPVDTTFQIEKPQLSIGISDHLSTQEVVDSALTVLPGVQKIEYQLNAAQKNLKAIKADMFPTITLNTGISTDYYKGYNQGNFTPYSRQIKNNLSEYVGASLSIPIFNGFYYKQRAQEAEIDLEIAKNKLNQKLITIENEVKQAITDLETAKSEHDAANKQLKAKRLASQTASKKLEKGLIDIITYTVAKNEMANAEAEALRTSLQLFLKMETVKFFMEGKIS
jgi:outer membrane protein